MSQTHKKKEIFSIRNTIIIIITLLAVFFAWNSYNSIQKSKAPVSVTISDGDHVIGNKNAKVQVIEYADFQCPYCASYDKVMTQLISNYQDKIFYVYKNFPLLTIHDNALLSAVGSEAAAKQGKFWEYKKVVFENQKDWESSLDAQNKIKSYLPSIGIDADKWESDLQDKTLQDKVMTSYQEAMDLGLNGTPSVIINGQRVDLEKIGSYEDLAKYIDVELAK